MKTVIIHGQNHKGSTYNIAHMLAEKIGGEITEYFLPKDFGEFCLGCTQCFMVSETKCPHYIMDIAGWFTDPKKKCSINRVCVYLLLQEPV